MPVQFLREYKANSSQCNNPFKTGIVLWTEIIILFHPFLSVLIIINIFEKKIVNDYKKIRKHLNIKMVFFVHYEVSEQPEMRGSHFSDVCYLKCIIVKCYQLGPKWPLWKNLTRSHFAKVV